MTILLYFMYSNELDFTFDILLLIIIKNFDAPRNKTEKSFLL